MGFFGRFKHGYEISLNRVHDTVTISENGEKLTLTVNADPMRLVAGLNTAQKKLNALVVDAEGKAKEDDPPIEEMQEAAELFAAVIFGNEQAQRLKEFYANDAACIISVCGTYFRERLGKKIEQVQKRMG